MHWSSRQLPSVAGGGEHDAEGVAWQRAAGRRRPEPRDPSDSRHDRLAGGCRPDKSVAPSVYAARRRRLNFVVSNPVLHSMPAAGWRRIANLVGGPRTAKIGITRSTRARSSLYRGVCSGSWSESPASCWGSPRLTVLSACRRPRIPPAPRYCSRPERCCTSWSSRSTGQESSSPWTGQGHVEVCFPADQGAAPTPPAFWGVSSGHMWSGQHVFVPRSNYAGARVAQARYIVELARRQASLHEPVALVSAHVSDVVKAASTSPNGYACIGRRP